MASPDLRRPANTVGTLSKSDATSRSTSRAFYELPQNKPTAAQIVRESRDWLQAVSTRRPFTPKDTTRSLFGSATTNLFSRSPSASKVGTRNFDLSELSKCGPPHFRPPECSTLPVDADCVTSQVVTQGNVKRIQNRGRVLKKFTSYEDMLPTRANLPRSQTTTDIGGLSGTKIIFKKNTRPTAQAKPQPVIQPQFELRGTQSKLLVHTPVRLISPILNKPRDPGSFLEDSESTRTSTHPSGRGNSVRRNPTPTRNKSDRSPSFSRSRLFLDRVEVSLTQSSYPPDIRTDFVLTDSRPQSTEHVTSEVCPSSRPNSLTEIHVPIRQSQTETPRIVGLPEPAQSTENAVFSFSQNKREKPSKARSGDLFCKNGIISRFDTAEPFAFFPLTSPSGDSGVSSGSELDYLIGRLSELPQRLMVASSSRSNEEMEVGKEDGCTRNAPETTHFGLMVEATEDEIVGLVDRLYTALRQSNIASKRQWPQRTAVLQAVFVLLDGASPRLCLALIRIVLTIERKSSNLVNACKLLYQVAKDSENDNLFLEHPDTLGILIDTLRSQKLSTNMESITKSAESLQRNCDLLLFLTGTLKFLSSSQLVAQRLNPKPEFVVILLETHRKVEYCIRTIRVGTSRHVPNRLAERLYHVLIQISEIFCNLSATTGLRARLTSPAGIMDHIVDCLIYRAMPKATSAETWQIEEGPKKSLQSLVYLNWVRFLARLTEYVDVCQQLDDHCVNQPYVNESLMLVDSLDCEEFATEGRTSEKHNNSMNDFCQALMKIFTCFGDEQGLIVRVAYLLGNLSARLDSARESLIPNHQALSELCALCRRYRQKTSVRESQSTGTSGPNTENAGNIQSTDVVKVHYSKRNRDNNTYSDDVLDKLVRILANAAIGENVGHLAVTEPDLLDLFLDLIAGESPSEPTELLLNCLAGLNNVTYYINADTRPEICAKQYDVAEALLQTMTNELTHPDVSLGCIRVFGNLTRQACLRDWLTRQGGASPGLVESGQWDWASRMRSETTPNAFLNSLIQNLDSARPELVYSTLGVLINLMTDVDQRPQFKQLGGLPKLVEALSDFAGHDWQLAGLACKTLWNYTESSTEPLSNLIPTEILNELYKLLSQLIDEEHVSIMHQNFLANDPSSESDSVELWRAAWSSEFLPVANEFLSRLTQN
ncbi:Armadillo repeat-containing protein [Paragonimus westermani]|uniref:Armadillo repeat-containing protein n=1 Tax=Paragonimus westermani TaxID=34504 RepID=A0A8T0DQI6_9TREM|nr:Armadillo repeat-containing protein [Paragonimus westermani]